MSKTIASQQGRPERLIAAHRKFSKVVFAPVCSSSAHRVRVILRPKLIQNGDLGDIVRVTDHTTGFPPEHILHQQRLARDVES